MLVVKERNSKHDLEHHQLVNYLVIISFVIALYLRISVIGKYGLSEDEVHKAIAVRSYLQLDFSHNPSHPALMKIFIAISVLILGESEFSLRLPNAIISSLTVFPIYLLGKELYDEMTGYFASLIWATYIPVLAFSTITKEDSFLTFFWVLSIYYLVKLRYDQKYLRHLGISIGLAAASKYTFVVLILLLIFLYIASYKQYENFPKPNEVLISTVKISIITFSIFNFPIFFPETLRLIIIGIIGAMTTLGPSHTGYYMMGKLYKTRPWYFLIIYLVVKETIPMLIVTGFGIFHSLLRKTYSNFITVSWTLIPLIIYSVIPFGYTRYLLVILPAISIIAVQGVILISDQIIVTMQKVRSLNKIEFSNNYDFKRKILVILISLSIVVNSVYTAQNISPYYRMYVNELGGGPEKAGYYFPEDSVYDYLVREAIFYLNDRAPLNSIIPTVIPLVGEYYGRDDLSFIPLIDYPPNLDILQSINIEYIIIQISRIYFENIELVRLLHNTLEPVKIYSVGTNEVVEIYQL